MFSPDSIVRVPINQVVVGPKPEDVALGPDGWFYTGLDDGRIVRFDIDTGHVEDFADIGDRPYGLGFASDSALIVAVKHRGLVRIHDRNVEVLTDNADGLPIEFADDLDIASDGTIWFSDLSTRFPDDLPMDGWEGRATGRLISFDPATRSTRVRADSLHFPNGVALAPDEQYVLVCETLPSRVTRLWLEGPRAGKRDVFLTGLPACVDNISYDDQSGLYLIALVAQRSAAFERYARLPFLRRVAMRIPKAPIPHQMPMATPEQRRGGIILVDTTGTVRVCARDALNDFEVVTSANRYGTRLLLGTVVGESIGWIQGGSNW